jgi:hypothetical protein
MVQRNDSQHSSSNEPATKEEWWVVWRQDDNGNQFAVARFHSRQAADDAANVFASHGHKQMYWVARQEATRAS